MGASEETSSMTTPLSSTVRVRPTRELAGTAGAMGLALVAALALLAPAAQADVGWEFVPVPAEETAVPPLPPTSLFPVQLVLDDDSSEGVVGVAGQTARQFLWFNRFTPGGPAVLEEVWVLFTPGPNMAVGNAIQLAVYSDVDGNPANGAVLLASFNETIQALDGNTFSVYPLAVPVPFDGAGDLLIGVIPRFIVSGVTSPTQPASIDTTASQGRSWLGVWSTDPPDPPVLIPPPDQQISTIDGFLPGNWMIRGFGTPAETIAIPTLGWGGLALLAGLLALAAGFFLRRRARGATLAAVALLALGLAAPAVGQTNIDTFTTNQAALADPPGGSSTATGAADIIGTRRGLVIDLLAGAGPVNVVVTSGALTLTVPNTTPDSRGEARISWDGDTAPLTLNPTGLGGVNLTTGGASGFRIRVSSSTLAGNEIEMRVHTNATSSSRASLVLPVVGAAQNFFLPFSEFIQAGDSAASFASVGAIEMTVRGKEGTFSLDEVVTAVPVIAATKVDALIIDNDSDLKADPGDRLRYTVTITNTGSEALSVDLTDTVDANTTLVAGSVNSTPVAKNDQYSWFGNVTLTVDGSPQPTLLANDTDPDGGTVSVSIFDATSAQGGTVSVTNLATGEFTYNPPAGFRGVDSFNYTIVDTDTPALTSVATARITLEGVVWFVDDSNTTPPHLGTLADPFQALASVNAVGDPDEPSDIIFVYDDDGTPYAGGLVLEADQQLLGEGVGLVLGGTTIVSAGIAPDITNAAGNGITLSANNTIRGLNVGNTTGVDIFGSGFGTLTVSNVALGGTGGALDLDNGALDATFTSVASTAGVNGIDLDTVTGSLAIAGATSISGISGTGIRINNPVDASFGTTTINAPTGANLTATGAGTFTFSSLAITATGGAGLSAAGGTFNIAGSGNTISATGGPAIDVAGVNFGAGATFASVSSAASPTKGVNLDTVTGSFVANSGSIGTATGIAFDVNAGASTITYAGSIANTANVALIEVTGRTGGTVTFSGNLSSTSAGNGIRVSNNNVSGTPTINFSGATKTLNTGADSAVVLDNNDVATINFTGGGLDIDTTSGTGFSAINGAVGITVQGTNNTIASTTGAALNVVSTTIGPSDLTFQSIAANGGTNGIVLNATGSSGGLTVTGNGGTCTVATPTCTGGTIQSTSDAGIALTSTGDVNLSFMRVMSGGNDGIRGTTVAGFTLASSLISANGNAAGENGIEFIGLTGSCSMTNVTVTGSAENNVVVRNSSGVLTAFTVTGSTFSSNSSIGADGLLFDATGTADITASVSGSTFTAHRDDHFQAAAANTSQLDITFSGNTLTGGHALALNQGITINAATAVPGYAGSVEYDILNNTINGAILNAIQVNLGTSSAAATMSGTISGNVIGTVGSFQSGSTTGSGIGVDAHGNGTHTVAITNNTIRQTFDRGINVLANDGSGTLNMTVTGNNSSHSDGTNSREGFFVNAGSADPNIFGVPDAHFVCLTLGGAGALRNTLTHGPGAPDDFRMRQRFNTTIRLPGYAGGAADTAAVVAFVNGNNISTTGSATVNTPPGGGFVGGAACPLP